MLGNKPALCTYDGIYSIATQLLDDLCSVRVTPGSLCIRGLWGLRDTYMLDCGVGRVNVSLCGARTLEEFLNSSTLVHAFLYF